MNIYLDNLNINDLTHKEPEPTIKTPWQGLNKILGNFTGDSCGLRQSISIIVIASELKQISAMMRDLHIGFGLFNTPVLLEPSNTPMSLNVLVDEDLATNNDLLYKRYHEHTGETRYDSLCKNGVEFHTSKVSDKNTYTVYDLFDEVTRFEEQGYEIKLVTFENLSSISKLDKDGVSMSITEIHQQARRFFASKNITFVTGELINEVVQCIRVTDTVNYLPSISRAGYYGNNSRICQEIDCEIFLDTSPDQTIFYVGKSRGIIRKDELCFYTNTTNLLPNYDFDGEDVSTIINIKDI